FAEALDLGGLHPAFIGVVLSPGINLLRSDRPKHPASHFAIQCESVCLSPSNCERLPLPNCFGVVGPKRASSCPVGSSKPSRNPPEHDGQQSSAASRENGSGGHLLS